MTSAAKKLPGRGTLLNTATVLVGAAIGMLLGKAIPDSFQGIVMGGIGLVTLAIGIKMFLDSKNVLIVVAAIVLGGALGMALGLHAGIESFSRWAEVQFGAQGSGTFAEAIITTSVLFCVGPMTLLGCMQDALEGKIELLAIKSTLDGFGAIFFAATLGPGVFVTAAILLVFQGALTFAAVPLKRLIHNEATIAEATASGGIMMAAIGINLLGIRADVFGSERIPVANYLPALFLAPAIASFFSKKPKTQVTEPVQKPESEALPREDAIR